MSISPFLPLAISTGSTLASQAASTLQHGLSSFADLLQNVTGEDPAEAAERQAAAEQSLHEFHQAALKVLGDAGVDLSFPVTLEADVRGALRLRGGHYQQEQIEQSLAENPMWSSAFQLLSDQLRAANPETAPGGQLRLTVAVDEVDFKFR